MVFQPTNKKLLELGPSLGFLLKKKRVTQLIRTPNKGNNQSTLSGI